MPYDKYRYWSETDHWDRESVKAQVLTDLAAASLDNTDRLEILDSFEVYVQRCYRKELAKEMSDRLLKAVSGLVTGAIESQITYPTPMGRGRAVKEAKQEAKDADNTPKV